MARSVLIVDDDTDTRMMLEIALTLRHFEVTLASNSVEALEVVKTREFDIFILDNWMPEITGIELCRELRTLDQKTPVVFLSGAGRHVDKAEALSAGADCYLTKPVDLDALVDCLNEWITKDHRDSQKSETGS